MSARDVVSDRQDTETRAAESDDTSTPTPFVQLIGDPAFGPFFATNSLSNIGNWFQNVAAGIVVFELTGSSAAVGAVSILQFAATMLLTPWMGALTDRVDRQRMLLVGQVIAFAAAGALAVTVFVVGVDGLPGPWPIYAATAMIGLGAAVTLPSLQAIVPALVRRRDLDRAIALNSMTFNIARSIGPIAAGTTVAALGAEWAFGVNALTFLPLIVALFLIRPRHDTAPADDVPHGTVREGWNWITDRKAVVTVLAATLVVGWTSDPFSTLMPALAEELGGGDTTVGLLVGAFGIGAALTAPVSDRIGHVTGRRRFVPVGLAQVAVGLSVTALAPLTALALAGAAVTGSGFLLGVTGTNRELQRFVPDELRGRVMAWWSVAFLGCRPVAALVDGLVADVAGVRTAIGVAAIIAAVAAAAGWRTGVATPVDDST